MPETDEERQHRIAALESGPERLEIPLHGLLEERVSLALIILPARPRVE